MIKQLEEQFTNLQRGQVEDSISHILALLTDPRMTDELRFNVAQYFYQLGFMDEALLIVQELVENYPDEAELLLFLAELYMENGQEDESLHILNSISPREDAYIRASILKADLYLLQGLYEVAQHKLKEAIQYFPEESVLYTALGEVFYQEQNYQLALLHFQRGETKPYDKLADCYAHLGRFEEALPMYKQALESTEHPDLLFGHGFVAIQLGEWSMATDSLTKLTRQDPYYTSAYPLLIQAHLQLNEVEEALDAVEAGLMYDQTNPELFYLKGELLLRQGDRKKAQELFEHSLDLDESYSYSLEKLLSLAEDAEDWPTCLSLVQQMREHSLERTDLLARQGMYYEQLEEWTQAEESYREALEQDPDDVEVINRLASLLRAEGSLAEALTLWHRSLKLDPNQWDISDLVTQLEME